ncbi:MAG: metallophosphoesterase [Phycisphaerales bacterium]|nr:MAG: metallophosphoesterase [Phycisphaerales bacterium]
MAEGTVKQPFSFVHISDPQFGMYPVHGGVFQETRLYEKTIAHVNRLSPAFLVNTGDLVDVPGDEEQLTQALRTARKLDKSIPSFTIPGNHDIADAPTTQTLDWYRSRIGKDWYSFDFGGWHFIGLNSCIIAHGKRVAHEAKKQLDWLRHDLEGAGAAGNSRIVVFMHHPLFLNDPEEADHYFNIPRETRQDYLDLFRKNGIRTIFAGHLHQNNSATDSSLDVVVTGPVGMPLGSGCSGFRIVTVHADHLEHKYVDLDGRARATTDAAKRGGQVVRDSREGKPDVRFEEGG